MKKKTRLELDITNPKFDPEKVFRAFGRALYNRLLMQISLNVPGKKPPTYDEYLNKCPIYSPDLFLLTNPRLPGSGTLNDQILSVFHQAGWVEKDIELSIKLGDLSICYYLTEKGKEFLRS